MTVIPSPLLASPQDDLAQTRKAIEQSQARQARIAEETRRLQAELKDIQMRLVRSAETVQRSEASLSASEEKLRILNNQLNSKAEALTARRRELAALVQAALALSRTPMEAIILMPGDPLQTMKAAHALKMASDAIRRQTGSIGLQMRELEQLKAKALKNRDEMSQAQTALDKEREPLERQLAERRALQEKLGKQQRQESEKLDQLARKAEDLQELLSSVSAEDRAGNLRPEERAAQAVKGRLRSFAAAKGHIHPPVAGRVVQAFGGAGQSRSDTGKGIVIAPRGNAQVTAPYDGEVVFSGPFLNYGKLVILRHSDDFHTLLAGLAKIDARVGQFLLEGEPIGAMGDSGFGSQDNKLYFELRKNNQPVDPAPWVNGLNRKN